MFDYISNSANGHDAQDVLQNKLYALRKDGFLSILVKTYRAGDPNARNVGQFYAPFMMQFNNGARWIVFSTTSCRTDRIKGQQWDADNLKRLDPTITKAILTYPDDVSPTEGRAFRKQKEKYDRGLEISSIDDVIPNCELIRQVKEYAADVFHERDDLAEQTEDTVQQLPSHAVLSSESQCLTTCLAKQLSLFKDSDYPSSMATNTSDEGKAFDFDGRMFEVDIANVLNNLEYLRCVKDGVNESTDRKYISYVRMLDAFGIKPEELDKVEATAEKEQIGLLPSGGQPKTDVWARFIMLDGSIRDVTVSCKRTTGANVSVHQYAADTYADVLSPGDQELRSLLNVFQFYANARDMPDADKTALAKKLSPHMLRLCRWVLGGHGVAVSNPIQLAEYLVVYNPRDEYFAVHSVEEYVQLLLRQKPKAFGTPFGWTYASKRRRECIQLKLPIIR